MGRILGQASALEKKDWAALDKVANTTHRTIWALTRFTAARIGEVLQLRAKDVYSDVSRREPLDQICYRRETRKGKDKNHTVPVCDELAKYLRAYPAPSDPNSYLFGNGHGGHLTYEAARAYLTRAAEKSGLGNKRVVTHSGRRSCITALARQGTDLKTIQAISGHVSIANVARYIETDPSRTKKALEGIF
jgi:integrase/recombinase XerD